MLGVRHLRSHAASFSAVILLHIQAAVAVSFQVLASTSPVSAPLGGTALLLCHISPPLSAQGMQVKWSRCSRNNSLQQDHKIHVYQPDGSEVQGTEYQGRTELLRDGMLSGSVGLRIRNLTLRDKGCYLCAFQSNTTDVSRATLELRVTSSGLDPLLYIGGYDGTQINVTCLSAGWYPKPELLWKNGRGETLTPRETVKFVKHQNLFSVSSSVVLTASSHPKLVCIIRSSSLGSEKVSTIHITDDFFPRVSSWKVGLFLFLSVCVCLLFLPACYFWRVQQAKRKPSNLTTKK